MKTQQHAQVTTTHNPTSASAHVSNHFSNPSAHVSALPISLPCPRPPACTADFWFYFQLWSPTPHFAVCTQPRLGPVLPRPPEARELLPSDRWAWHRTCPRILQCGSSSTLDCNLTVRRHEAGSVSETCIFRNFVCNLLITFLIRCRLCIGA